MGIHRKYSGTITRSAATASGTQDITGVGGRPIAVLFYGMDDADANTYCKGMDDGALAQCIAAKPLTVLLNLLGSTANVTICWQNQTQSIEVQNGSSNGHSANISAMGVDGFTLNWTKTGSGRAITVKYIAIL